MSTYFEIEGYTRLYTRQQQAFPNSSNYETPQNLHFINRNIPLQQVVQSAGRHLIALSRRNLPLHNFLLLHSQK
jgi:hypothetical protein